MTEHFDDEKDEIIDGDITEKNDDHEDDSDYEKFCFLCHRPESQAGKMIELPNNIHICNDCMQKSFDTMTQQMNNGLNLNDLLNMPNVSMINLGSIQDAIPRPKKVKKKKEDAPIKAKTSHTLNKVPFIVYGADVELKQDENLGLSNVAATVADLLGIEPNEHWNPSIIKK